MGSDGEVGLTVGIEVAGNKGISEITIRLAGDDDVGATRIFSNN